MPKTPEEVTKDAMTLPPRQRLVLAELLLESANIATNPLAQNAWDEEIRHRIKGIEEGHVTGIAYSDVMRAAEKRLAP
jgi:hypothetical protein